MKAKDIMTESPACCTPASSLREAAALMCENDCGEIPVVNNKESMRPVGVITDRDIACRSVALGKNALELTVEDCMTQPCVTVPRDINIEDCCKVLEENKIRRVPVVDEDGKCCGIVAQADIAQHASKIETATVVKGVSQPKETASRVTAG